MQDLELAQAVRAAARNRYWRERDAAVVLAAMADSGLTLSAFARQWDISVSRLRRWQRRLADKPVPVFHPVEIVAQGQVVDPTSRFELVLRNGHRVVVPDGFDEHTLQRLVRLMDAL